VARQESSSTLSTSERIGIGVGVIVLFVVMLWVFFALCRKKKASGGAYHLYLDNDVNGDGKILTMNDLNESVYRHTVQDYEDLDEDRLNGRAEASGRTGRGYHNPKLEWDE